MAGAFIIIYILFIIGCYKVSADFGFVVLIGSFVIIISGKKIIPPGKKERAFKNALKSNTMKKEFIDYIDSNFVKNIKIYESYIIIGEKKISYSEKGYSDLKNEDECYIFAQSIKDSLKYKKLYVIKPIKVDRGGSSSKGSLIGFTQTYNGNFVANYSGDHDLGTVVTIGYELVLSIKEDKVKEKGNEHIDSWKK